MGAVKKGINASTSAPTFLRPFLVAFFGTACPPFPASLHLVGDLPRLGTPIDLRALRSFVRQLVGSLLLFCI